MDERRLKITLLCRTQPLIYRCSVDRRLNTLQNTGTHLSFYTRPINLFSLGNTARLAPSVLYPDQRSRFAGFPLLRNNVIPNLW